MQVNWVCVFFTAIVLAACSTRDIPHTPTEEIYPSPTSDSSVIHLQETASARLTAENQPTPTPKCMDSLSFIEDVTIPDETIVEPGERLDKRWRVENVGSCNWDERYRIELIAGPDMDAPPQQALYPALSGTEAVIRIIYTAPEEPGAYRSVWQAFDPHGNAFGNILFIDIMVDEK